MNRMEMLLWDYIDGNCTAEEETYVREMLQKDKQWQAEYEELLSFNRSMHTVETEQPSLRFAKNVMDAVAEVKTARLPNKNWVIWGLAIFFVAAIAAGLIWALNSGSSSSSSRISFPEWSVNSRGLLAFLLGDIVVALLMIDQLIRKRRAKSLHA